jgi:hypothetical protein
VNAGRDKPLPAFTIAVPGPDLSALVPTTADPVRLALLSSPPLLLLFSSLPVYGVAVEYAVHKVSIPNLPPSSTQ